MSSQYRIHNQQGLYFVTLTIVDWIDVFTRREQKLTVVNSLEYCQKHKGLVIYAWCLMHSHLHILISAKEGFNLSDIIRDFKKFTSKEIIRKINDEPESRREWMLYRFEYAGKYLKRIKDYKVWQDGNMAKEIYGNEFLKQKLDYIHNNPVEEMVVAEPHHYLYSSAVNYAGEKGLLEVELIQEYA